jgi:hypothetical protein
VLFAVVAVSPTVTFGGKFETKLRVFVFLLHMSSGLTDPQSMRMCVVRLLQLMSSGFSAPLSTRMWVVGFSLRLRKKTKMQLNTSSNFMTKVGKHIRFVI